jgi:transcriptional regulator with XRE-family HTH domain
MLAELLETSQSQISDWIREKSMPSISTAVRLAHVLGVSMDYLFDDSLEEPPKPDLTSEERMLLAVIRRLGPEEAMFRLAMCAGGPVSERSGSTQATGRTASGLTGTKGMGEPGE